MFTQQKYIQIITVAKVYTLDIFLHNKGYLIYPKDISTKKADIKGYIIEMSTKKRISKRYTYKLHGGHGSTL